MQSTPDDPQSRSLYNQDGDLSQGQGRLQKKNHRPRMSCHQCRLRKIRCDRVYPCTACCSRGKPKDCVYPVDANNKAIDQSQEIKALRKQVHELQSEISKLRSSSSENRPQYPYSQSLDASTTEPTRSKFPAAQSRPPFHGRGLTDPGQNISYNTPPSSSMGNFSDMECPSGFDQLDNKNEQRISSLAHTAPRDVDLYAYQDAAADPFPSLWQSSRGVGELLHLLPPREDIFFYLEGFQVHVRAFFSYQMSAKEIRHFLADLPGNAEKNPQMLGFLFAAIARGVPFGVFKKHGQWVQGTMESELVKADLYIAAAMHALRLSSFMNRPTILCLQTLLIIGPYLINTGKFLDAYTLFGVTVRVAQGMGLYQNPEDISPRPSAYECHLRENIWWRLLLQDQYYSRTLGRPLGISTMGDISLQSSYMRKSANPACISRLDTYTTRFTALSRQIISCSHLSNNEIDKFSDSLLQLQDILPPEERFDKSWLCADTELPQWPSNLHAIMLHSNIHDYLILLNRRRQDNNRLKRSPQSGVQTTSERTQERGYFRVISSCHELLSAFSLLHQRIPIGLAYWDVGQQAFNAAMVLGLNILETRDFTDLGTVMAARDIFGDMQVKQICQAAKLAVSRLNIVLEAINGSRPSLDEKVMSNRGMILAEDPEIRGAVGEPYNPLTLRLSDGGRLRPNMNGSRLASSSPSTQYSDVHRKTQAKQEINGRVEGFGDIPRYQSPCGTVNNFPPTTGYNKDLQSALPFPSTIVARDGDKRPYNTGVDDPRKMLRMGTWPSSMSSACTMGNQNATPYVYTSAGLPQHHQQPVSYPSSEPGPLGYAFPNNY